MRKYPHLRLPRIRRYPVWNPRTITAVAALVVGICTTLVLVAGQRSLFVELELALGLVAACLFAFLTLGLYRGIRLRKDTFPHPSVPKMDGDSGVGDSGGGSSWHDLPTFDFDFGDDLGCFGVVLGLIAMAVALIGLLALIYFVLPYFLVGILFLLAAVYWVFYLALRRVFVLSRKCRGDWPRSLLYGAGYTALYTSWLFLMLFAAGHWLK
jgi:hypothetical protein